MDVVCERCKTEYEFDDALVSERGTTVKCTSCGHQFKIYRPAFADGPRASWQLRRPDGTVLPFDSLAVLQKWILEGRVTRADEISRPNEPWKPLGAIAELESFFLTAEMRAAPTPQAPSNRPPPPPAAVLRAQTPSRGAPGPLPKAPHTLRPAIAPPPSPSPAAARGPSLDPPELPRAPSGGVPAIPPPPRLPSGSHRAAVSTVEGYTLDPAIGPPPASRKGPSLPPLPNRPVDRSGTTPPPADRSGANDSPPDRSATNNRSAPPPALSDTDDEVLPPVVPSRGRVRTMFVGLGLGLAVMIALGGAAWQLGLLPRGSPSRATSANPSATEVTRHIETARQLVARYTVPALDDAREALARALTLAPNEPTALALRVHLLALHAELLRQQADDLEARSTDAEAPARRAEATVLRREADERVARLRSEMPQAEAAVASLHGEARAEAEARLADAARVAGDSGAAQRHLEASRLAGPNLMADLVAALVARDAGLATQATEGLRAVVARAGDHVRARLVLARTLLASGDAPGARRELEALLQIQNDRVDARLLLAGLDERSTLAQGPDAGTMPQAPDAALPGRAIASPAPESTASRRSDTPPMAGRSYAQLVNDGERLLRDRMEIAQARERFRAALAQRPDGCEALTGMGDVDLEDRELSSAIAYFRRALAICPRHSDAWVGLGQAYTAQQRYEQAIEAYTRYLEVNPGGAHAHMARRHIEQLRERTGAPSTPPGN